MIRTHGLDPVSLSVRDPERSLAFYTALFGVREYHRDEKCIHVREAQAAGATILRRGEFDPDGYTIEIWFE